MSMKLNGYTKGEVSPSLQPRLRSLSLPKGRASATPTAGTPRNAPIKPHGLYKVPNARLGYRSASSPATLALRICQFS